MTDNPTKVLVIEDNSGDARLIREMLAEAKRIAFNIECVDRLSEGVQCLAEKAFDVILLDLSLPDGQGLNTFDRVHAQAPEVPIVVLTGVDDEEIAVQAVREGAEDYVAKGKVNSELLVRVIRYAIERHRILMELKQRFKDMEASEARFREQRDKFAAVLANTTRQFEEKVQELSVVRRIGESLKYTRDVQKSFEVIIDTVIEETSAETCSLMLLDRETGELSVKAARGETDAAAKYYHTAGTTFRLVDGIAGWVAKRGEALSMPDISSGTILSFYPELNDQGEPIPVPDLSETPLFVSDSDSARPIGSLLCLPLVVDNEVIGVVNMSHPRPNAFSDEAKNLVALITDQAAIALRNVQIFDTKQQSLDNKAAEEAEGIGDGTFKVLLVEDNPGDARLLEEMIAGTGNAPFDLTCVERLSEGLERLGNGRIDAVLLDLSLPDSQGFDTFVRMHAHAPEVPIIVLTGLDDQEIAIQAVQKGAQDYLVKGQVEGDSLTRAIRYAIERKRLEAQLGEFHELKAVERMTEGFNHQFKNIITGIMLSVQTARMDAGEGIQGPLEIAEEASVKVADMVQQLALFSQRMNVDKMDINVLSVVNEVAESCRSTFDPKISIDIQSSEETAVIDGDMGKLKQVFLNLCTNARDALEALSDTDRQLHISINLEQAESEQYIISVSDNGVGMDEETQEHIFEPFFTTKPNDEGLGLGLAISSDIVKQHNGWIDVESQFGEGTTFRVYLPVAGSG